MFGIDTDKISPIRLKIPFFFDQGNAEAKKKKKKKKKNENVEIAVDLKPYGVL